MCHSKENYTSTYVTDNLVKNQRPMIWTCPPGTVASTIRLAQGTGAYAELAEIEVAVKDNLIYEDQPFTEIETFTESIKNSYIFFLIVKDF